LRGPLLVIAATLAGCSDRTGRAGEPAARENDVPIAINGESPFQYPADLYDQGVEGEVRLKLYVDALGRVHAESTRVAVSSGSAALDSTALAGAAQLRFAPAHRAGEPVGMTFYQPVIFRRQPTPGSANIQ
jgi:TonB family protein